MPSKWMNGLAVALVAVSPLEAQTGAPPRFGVQVTVVSLPVFVTDKDGKAVPGLTAGDFEIQDEGKPVKIVGFQEIDATQPLPEMGERAAVAARRQFLLLFDLSFTSVSGLLRARSGAQDFVAKQLGPSDLAGVATISVTGGVRLLVGFTSDRGQLQRAIEGLGLLDPERKADPLAITYDSALDMARTSGSDRSAATTRPDEFAQQLRSMQILFLQGQAQDYQRKVGALTASLGNLARALDAVRGRKQILYLSAGYSDTLTAGETGEAQRQSGEAVIEGRLWEVQSDAHFGDASLRTSLEKTLKSFSSADVVVHTIDVIGLGGGPDASEEGHVAPGSGAQSLNQIAQDTGGRFIRNTNNLGQALGEVLEASQHYYVLTFEPEGLKGPGKLHKLKLRVAGSGRTASSRTGWIEGGADAGKSPLAPVLESAEAIVKGLSGGEIHVSVLAVPYRHAEGKATLPVVLEVDGPSLLERGSGTNLTLDIFGYALGQDGGVEDLLTLGPTLDVQKVATKLKDRGLQVQTAFTLSPGSKSLRFLVRDRATGRRGFATLPVTVPSLEAGSLALSAPLLMDDPVNWVLIQFPSRASGSLALPFHVDTDVFTPRVRPALANGRTDRVCLLFYGGGRTYDAGTQFEIKTQLLDEGGAPVRLGKLSLAKAVVESDGVRRFVLAVTPSDVPAGDYTLKVRLKDPASGSVVEGAEPIRVE